MAFLLGECLLKQLIDDNGLTQAEFARRMECSPQFISGLIRGKEKMSLEFAINASLKLDCDVKELYELIPVVSRKG